MFPEFYFLDCHSCHRRIYDQAKPVKTSVDNPGRAALPEGMPPYNDENLIMLSAAARVAAPALADQLAARTTAFHKAMTIDRARSEEHTSELQSLMRISYAVFCLKKQNRTQRQSYN